MSKVAFYAPLKSPNHPNPSGDREIARHLMLALTHAGFVPNLVSELRTREAKGDTAAQAALIAQADVQIPDLIARGRTEGWGLWLTYHNYYKAPDLLGPKVAQTLGIPYVQIESTRARKRLSGPWARFAEIAEGAAHDADVIFYFTERDAVALRNYAPNDQLLTHLRPFLPQSDLPAPSTRNGPILTVAMMRPGDKLASYALIAETLALVPGTWALHIAGDGNARHEVEALMLPFGDRVQFLGALNAAEIAREYDTASILFWPGVNEAIGMIYLEAQARGIPVLAQNRPGLIDVLAPHLDYPMPEDGPGALARRLTALVADPPDPGPTQTYIQKNHLLAAAAQTLKVGLEPLIQRAT